MKLLVLAAQPDLPGQRAARGAVDRRRDLPGQRPRDPRAERTLQREIVATGALVEQLRTDAHPDVHDDGAAHRRRAEAEGGGRHQRSADRAGHRRRLPDAAEARTCCWSPTRPAQVLATVGGSPRAARVVAEPAGGARARSPDARACSLLPQPDGILQLVTVPIAIGLAAARDPRHAQRRLPARRRARGAAEADHRQRRRVRHGRPDPGGTLPRDAHAGAGAAGCARAGHLATCTLGGEEYVALPRPLPLAAGDGAAGAGPVALILRSRTEQLQFARRRSTPSWRSRRSSRCCSRRSSASRSRARSPGRSRPSPT